MNLDKYINSQTLKTSVFVIVVLLVFLFVFKLGVFHGYKKATHSQIYGHNFSQIYKGTSFSHYRGAFGGNIHGKFLFSKKFIEDKMLLDSKTDEGYETVDLAQ